MSSACVEKQALCRRRKIPRGAVEIALKQLTIAASFCSQSALKLHLLRIVLRLGPPSKPWYTDPCHIESKSTSVESLRRFFREACRRLCSLLNDSDQVVTMYSTSITALSA